MQLTRMPNRKLRKLIEAAANNVQFSYNDLIAEVDRRRGVRRDRWLITAGVLTAIAASLSAVSSILPFLEGASRSRVEADRGGAEIRRAQVEVDRLPEPGGVGLVGAERIRVAGGEPYAGRMTYITQHYQRLPGLSPS